MRTTAILVAAALASLGNASAFTSPPGSLRPRAPSPLTPSTLSSSSSSSAHNSGRSGRGLYCGEGDAQKGEDKARSNTRRLFLGLGLGLSVQASSSSSSSSASVIRMSGGGVSGSKPSVGFLGMGIMGECSLQQALGSAPAFPGPPRVVDNLSPMRSLDWTFSRIFGNRASSRTEGRERERVRGLGLYPGSGYTAVLGLSTASSSFRWVLDPGPCF